MSTPLRLGELLLAKKLITPEQLDEALAEQRQTREFLGGILVKKQFIREDDILKALSEQFDISYVRLADQKVDWTIAVRFTSSLVVDHRCLPIRETDGGFTVAITNPLDAEAVSMAEQQAKGRKVKLVLVSTADMDEALKKYRELVAAKIKKMLDENS